MSIQEKSPKFKGTPAQIRTARIEFYGAIAIALLAIVWILANILKSPEQFAQVALLGLRNGLLYALIALGEISQKQGNKAEAKKYFNLVRQKASRKDEAYQDAKRRLKRLEKGDR